MQHKKQITKVTAVDCHAHIFHKELPLVAGRRYSPKSDALPKDYFKKLDDHLISHAVVLQPSFLGTDNSYLISVVEKNLSRLRGIVVVANDISDQQLNQMNSSGIVGVRFNLINKQIEDYSLPIWQRFLAKLRKIGWKLDIHRSIKDIHKILPPILESGVEVIVDHFALTNNIDPSDQNHNKFLSLLKQYQVWIKISAAYRAKSSIEQAKTVIQDLHQVYGHSSRFLWGSDWPNTQFEKQTNYEHEYEIMQQILPNKELRKKILVENPRNCFNFCNN